MGNSQNREPWCKQFFNRILPTLGKYDFKAKDENITQHVVYMLNRTQRMFEWKGLPDSIPQRIVELYLQINGNICFYKLDGTLYVFFGGLGGEPDEYYRPTLYTVANPFLKFSGSLKIGKDCVVFPNDSMFVGLIPLFKRYATAITENELSLKVAMVNSRIMDIITGSDERTQAAADLFLKHIEDGELGAVLSDDFTEGVKVLPTSTVGNRVLTDLIETEQYLKASWFNELGLNANYNMKRESLNSSESQLNNDALLPLVDDMLKCRKLGAEKVNEMFGTDISVELASSWEDNQIEVDEEQNALSGQPENPDETKEGETDEVEKT